MTCSALSSKSCAFLTKLHTHCYTELLNSIAAHGESNELIKAFEEGQWVLRDLVYMAVPQNLLFVNSKKRFLFYNLLSIFPLFIVLAAKSHCRKWVLKYFSFFFFFFSVKKLAQSCSFLKFVPFALVQWHGSCQLLYVPPRASLFESSPWKTFFL